MAWKKIAEANFLLGTSLSLARDCQMEEADMGGEWSYSTEVEHPIPELLSQGTKEEKVGHFPPHLDNWDI